MSYIGQGLPADTFQGFTTDKFTGDGTANKAFTLTKEPFSEDTILVTIDGVVQEPTDDFTVSGTTLTLVGTAPNGSEVNVTHMGGPLPIGGASELDLNGASDKLVLDADGDTTISADTDDQIDFKTGGTDRLTIQSTSGNNVVVADGLTLTDGNLIVASGHGIDFSATGDGSGTTASELFDDYEEGTFNGAFSGSSGAPSGVSYSHRENHYVKIGDTVFFSGYLQSSSWSSGPSGHLLFSGLPFTASSASNYFGMFNVHYSGNFNATDAPQTGYIPQGQTYANFITNAGSDARSGRTTTVSASNSSGNEIVVVSGFYKVA